jgi:hypothetical protein
MQSKVLAQSIPHPPQWLSLVIVSTQELPQRTSEPQSTSQVPALQTSLSLASHALSHAPQCIASVDWSTHAPTDAQNISPVGHTHVPLLHDRPPVHAAPQAPQLASSVSVSMQLAPQTVAPLGHSSSHVPAAQCSIGSHSVSQAPQCSGLFVVLTQPAAPQSI